MYKAFFIDIDKTLLNSQGKVTAQTREAIEKAKEQGVGIFLISGRSRAAAVKFQELSSRYIINSNGSDIYDCRQEKILYQSKIGPIFCRKLYEMAEKEDVVIKFDFGPSRAVNHPAYLEDYEVELKNINPFLAQHQVIQIGMCCEDLEKVEKIKNYVKQQTSLEVVNQFIWEVKDKVMQAIHITNPDVSKGNAMSNLCQHLKIDLRETVAIGDKINDISMIEKAGLGVAMENATENVKQAADFVTTSNDNDGVAKVLNKFLF